MHHNNHKRISARAVNSGLLFNIFLAILKTTAGVLGNSTALLADGINSVTDVVYYILVKVFMRIAGKPPDKEHPFGHRQFESVAALVVGAFVITTAVAIFWEALNRVITICTQPQQLVADIELYTLYVALFTVVLKLALSLYTAKVAKKTASAAIFALAYDHRSDMFASMAAALGIALGKMGLLWVDPLAGALVAIIIFKTGIAILSRSSSELISTVVSGGIETQVRSIISSVAGVDDIEQVQVYRFGPYFVINVTIGVAGNITVFSGNVIATAVENELISRMDFVQQVHVHYHPVYKR